MQSLDFFTSRVGTFIKRGTTDVFIADDTTALALYNLQDEKKGYVFSAPVRVHRREMEECEACSA